MPAAVTAKISGGAKNSIGTKALAAKASTLAAIGCESCHVTHNAGGKKFLMQSAVAEQNCFVCHNGTTVQKNVQADFEKTSVHPITLNSDSHSPDEDPINPPERHVTCADCHNAHAANKSTAVAPNISGAMAGVTGVTAAGGIIKPAQKEYEVCFRCHADSIERGPATVTRQFPQTNTRLQFATGNQSFHPVEAVGKNSTSVPSLISPTWTVNSVIYCTDCHNSDTGPGAGGSGANGPHGSAFSPLLERNLDVTDFQAEKPGDLRALLQMPQPLGRFEQHQLPVSPNRHVVHGQGGLHDLPRFARRRQRAAPDQFQHDVCEHQFARPVELHLDRRVPWRLLADLPRRGAQEHGILSVAISMLKIRGNSLPAVVSRLED